MGTDNPKDLVRFLVEQSVAGSIRKEVIFLDSLLEFLAKHKNLMF